MDDRALTDDERFPLIGEEGRRHLDALRQHPHAPRYNMTCGDRLTAAGLARVQTFERELASREPRWRAGELPPWVREFARRCLRDVPVYRNRGGSADDFEHLPSVDREILKQEPWNFVPDDQPLDDMINYFTSGTSGQRIDVLSHPDVASMRLPIFRKALGRFGVTLDGGAGRIAIAFICSQSTTFTYPTLSAYLGGAGMVKVNLNPGDWRDPDDRVKFLDELDPEILTGDPLSFSDLAELPVKIRPKAMISSAMLLVPPIRERLESRFACPVVDIYSTCETGPIALRADRGLEVLPHDIYVETLRDDGTPAAPGERGEIAITGGRNPFLPLLRYRTGDWAAMAYDGDVPMLVDFDGRPPVVFRGTDGHAINNIDVTIAMRRFPLTRFSVHQNADGSLDIGTSGAPFSTGELESAMRRIFGAEQRMAISELPADGRKVIPYSTSL